MQTLKESILKSVKGGKDAFYTKFPKNKHELISIIKDEIEKNGADCDLNYIDVSKITDMSGLFLCFNQFNGDISKWDVSNVQNMSWMFTESDFDGNISKWDVSSVKSMESMFANTRFNGDISKWDVSGVKNMSSMFFSSKFNNDSICNWNVSNVTNTRKMFYNTDFNQDLSGWHINDKCDTVKMFYRCRINEKYIPKGVKYYKIK